MALYPTLILKNQFGEESINSVFGGSNQIDINFIVDSTNGNGLGIRSLKGAGVANVYMHTSATPAAGNPNPAPGLILVQLSQEYTQYLGGYSGFVSPVSGTPINVTTGTTLGLPYVIVSLGTTTLDQWQKLGLPANVTPAVGVSFVAVATTTATGTGVIEVPKATGSGIGGSIEAVGNLNLSINTSDGSGGWMLFQCLSATNSSTTTLQATAPADGSVVGMRFVLA